MLKINFYDDGAATEPEAVCAAIETLTRKPQHYLWLWICGKDKGGEVDYLSKLLAQKLLAGNIFKLCFCSQIGLRVQENLLSILSTTYQTVQARQVDFLTANLKYYPTLSTALKQELTSLAKIAQDFKNWQTETKVYFDYGNLTEKPSAETNLISKQNLTYKQKQSSEEINLVLNIALSPGGSSLDEFKNYLERSALWLQVVNDLV